MSQLFVEGVRFEWDRLDPYSYVRHIEAFKDVREIDFQSPVTFFIGENGSGKSTLLEALAITQRFNPEGGTKNYCFTTFDSHSDLHEAMRVLKGYRKEKGGYFYRAESFYNVATQEMEYAGPIFSQRYHEKSHGESFLSVMQNYLEPNELYFFDEPEAALSPQRQLTLLFEINRCVKQGSQFFIATHSPILLGLPGADIYTFDAGQIHRCEYEETDSYRVMEMFINHRERILEELLSE